MIKYIDQMCNDLQITENEIITYQIDTKIPPYEEIGNPLFDPSVKKYNSRANLLKVH